MIVPMKKVTLFTLKSDEESALAALRALGIMQVDYAPLGNIGNAAALSGEFEAASAIAAALGKRFDGIPVTGAAHHRSGAEALEEAAKLLEQETKLAAEADAVRRRRKTLEVWGEFKFADVEKLRAKGIFITLCCGSRSEFEAAQKRDDLEITVIDDAGSRFFFVAVSTSPVAAGELPEFRITADDDPESLKKRAEELEIKLRMVAEEIAKLQVMMPLIRRRVEQLESSLEFARARESMADLGPVSVLTGFVPEPECVGLSAAARKNGWGLLIDDPAPDDNVPTLIKRSRFAELVAPFFEFLGISPGYNEIDVSSGVLIFFTIFYAMIVGDAGYGLVFLIATLALGFKFRRNKAAALPVRLMVLLSCATIVWGIMTDNMFGRHLPGFLSWANIDALTDPAVKDANTMCLCFVLALAQLTMGRLWRAIHIGTVKGYIANIGWSLVLAGNFLLILKLLVYPGAMPVGWLGAFFGGGLAMVIISDVNWKNPADVFQFPFNVIGSFTDVLSYIRLFAVGLAGFYIADSFNGMGKSLYDVSAWLLPAAALVILFGHVLNLALCVMSVMVHGVRLNTLEFSNHVGLTWGGYTFRPFKNRSIAKQEEI